MPEFNEAALMTFFSQYAYEPMYVYGFICLFMFAASFGLPIPEELVLISAGLVAHMAKNPAKFPPPYPGAESVNTITLCIVSFLAVFGSDFFVYGIGRIFGTRIIKTKFFQKQVAGDGFNKINSWFQKYGGWACGIFRFTPGLRFPGHLSCGLLNISAWKFIAVDGTAALLSVPTQIYFVSVYGDVILDKLTKFKIYVLYAAIAAFVAWGVRKIYLKNVRKNV
ncbi:MAG TPA: DedA family protein [Bacteriovoracaceae bacterium]|nr:DedA family protein [Bacteriovoracaceae bacterium]